MSTHDESEDLLVWLEAHQSEAFQNRIADYVQRGRRFGDLPLEQLRRIYIAAIDGWAHEDGDDNPMPADGLDSRAELDLRAELYPDKELRAANILLAGKALRTLERDRESPDELKRLFAPMFKDWGLAN